MHPLRRAALVASLLAVPITVLVTALPAEAAVGDRYVALGDSYASGLGAGSYTAESGNCKRSTNAYPALWAAASVPTSYTSVACSGATVPDVHNSQLAAVTATTTLVTITIGGNDIGFASIMTTCVLSGTAACIDSVQAAENLVRTSLGPALDALYTAISARAPKAKVVVLGYPVFYQLGTICIGLAEAARAKINEGINLLDDVTAGLARQHGFTFADVRANFVGHQLCSGARWLYALDILNLTQSYHPTAAGQSGGYFPALKTAAN